MPKLAVDAARLLGLGNGEYYAHYDRPGGPIWRWDEPEKAFQPVPPGDGALVCVGTQGLAEDVLAEIQPWCPGLVLDIVRGRQWSDPGPVYYDWLLVTQAHVPARETLGAIAELIASSLPPVPGQESGAEGRRAAVAASFRQLAEIGGDLHLTKEDAWWGFERLGFSQAGDPPPVIARRLTCRQVAALIVQNQGARAFFFVGGGEGLATVMDAVVARFEGSDDPRQKAMAATAAREAAEVRGISPELLQEIKSRAVWQHQI